MTKTLIRPRFFSKMFKQKPKPQKEKTNSSKLPPSLQLFNQNILSGNSFLVKKKVSIEDSVLLDNETIDSSIIKRNFLKIYHQQAANIIVSDQNNDFIFDEKK